MSQSEIFEILCGKEAQKLCVAYHEAGHVIGAWLSRLPLREAAVYGADGVTRVTRLYEWTTMFRAVDRSTVENQMHFLLGGMCAEALLPFGDPTLHAELDRWHAKRLARRFAIDLNAALNETADAIRMNADAVARIAKDLFRKKRLGAFDLMMHKVNWLAQGTNRGMIVS